MPLDVQEILKLDPFKGARILAGEEGIGRRVTTVTVGEVPDIADWLTGGELVLSTLYAVGDDPAMQLAFVERLMASGAAALIVKSKRFVKRIDGKVLKAAGKGSFPIIEVKSSLRWTDLIQEVTGRIIGSTLRDLERSRKIQDELVRIVIEGGGWNAIAETAAALIGRAIRLENDLGHELAAAGAGEDESLIAALDALPRARREPAENAALPVEERLIRTPLDEKETLPARVILPIIVSGEEMGSVITYETSRPLNELDQAALQSTATVAALESGLDRARLEAETRIYGDLMAELRSVDLGDEEVVTKARSFGFDLRHGLVAVAVQPDFQPEDEGGASGQAIARRLEYLMVCSKDKAPGAIVSPSGDGILIILPAREGESEEVIGERADRLASSMQVLASRSFRSETFSVGIGRPQLSASGIRRCTDESVLALRIGLLKNGPGAMTRFADVGGYAFLHDLYRNEPESVQKLYDETVGRLFAYDAERGSGLVATLERYFASDDNMAGTAAALFVHPKTVAYRMQRIAEVSGLDPMKHEDRGQLDLGLKAAHLLRNGS